MKYEHSIVVSGNDIDELRHVNNVVYVRYVQEAANAHWNAVTTDEIRRQHVWVVMRHEIDYISPAYEGDVLIATTWVGDTNGARSERHVKIKNKMSGKLIVRAKTLWCQLDATSFKPKRVDESIVKMLTAHSS
jgi:acyl-CoA thioester hydrolase